MVCCSAPPPSLKMYIYVFTLSTPHMKGKKEFGGVPDKSRIFGLVDQLYLKEKASEELKVSF